MAANMILVLVVLFAFQAATAVFHFSEPISLGHDALAPFRSRSEVARGIQKVRWQWRCNSAWQRYSVPGCSEH